MSAERTDDVDEYMAGKEPSVNAAGWALVGMLIVIAIGCMRYAIVEMSL